MKQAQSRFCMEAVVSWFSWQLEPLFSFKLNSSRNSLSGSQDKQKECAILRQKPSKTASSFSKCQNAKKAQFHVETPLCCIVPISNMCASGGRSNIFSGTKIPTKQITFAVLSFWLQPAPGAQCHPTWST